MIGIECWIDDEWVKIMLVVIYYFEIGYCVMCECVFFGVLDGLCEMLIGGLLYIEGDMIVL